MAALRYRSSRGSAPEIGFADALLGGLAPDGGLYLPTHWPTLSDTDSGSDADPGSYVQLAVEVMWPFVDGSIDHDAFVAMVRDAYSTFDHRDVCPLVKLDDHLHLLELFHGPTLAFKDVALQLVGRLFDYELCRRERHMTIVAATSGDTGGAAMEAIRGLDRVDIVVLFPHGRTTDVQRRQMTTLVEPNVHAVAIDGTFDDCQDLVKAMFADAAFAARVGLGAVNSINWARVMAQIVYYVWAHRLIAVADRPVTFCVPSGNFGNVFAGHVARRMGLPMQRLIVASNTNDVLTRLITDGKMTAAEVVPTLSPSMDIRISSNLERLLFELFDGNGPATAEFVARFRSLGYVALSADRHDRLASEFSSARINDSETLAVMRRIHKETGLLIDPHTAVGIGAAGRLRRPGETVVTLGTAHPAKFGRAVELATGIQPELPPRLANIHARPERFEYLPNDLVAVQEFVDSVRAPG